jgi:transcriptional regulator with GAF, ATPase, and Fis domain
VLQLDVATRAIVADATEALIGHTHVDALSYGLANALVPELADVSVLDLRLEHDRVWRILGGSRDPSEADLNRHAVLGILPPPDVAGSPLLRVMDEGRVLAHGELGGGGALHTSHAVLATPLFDGDAVIGVLSLVTFGRHDRYGRNELTATEEIGDRFVRALLAVRALESARRTAQESASYRELMSDTVRTLEAGLTDMKLDVESLRAENLAMRAMLESSSYEPGTDSSQPSVPLARDNPPAPTPMLDDGAIADVRPRRGRRDTLPRITVPLT